MKRLALIAAILVGFASASAFAAPAKHKHYAKHPAKHHAHKHAVKK